MILADLGALHANLPTHNAQTVLELLHHTGRERVLLTAVTSEQWNSGAWKDLENPVLFALHDAKISAEAIGPDWAWAQTENSQMLEFLKQFPQGRTRLQELARAKSDLQIALAKPLDTQSIYNTSVGAAGQENVLESVRSFHARLEEILEFGPGTSHRAARIEKTLLALKKINLENTAMLVPLDDVPALQDAGYEMANTKDFLPGEASRFRALVDRAYRLEENDDLNVLVHNLLALDGPADSVLGRMALEARFAASGLYLAVGDLESATDLLEAVANAQFDRPAYLPALVLARLGQVRDLAGERQRALRAYQAALGLSWLPATAREACEHGLTEAFKFVEPGA